MSPRAGARGSTPLLRLRNWTLLSEGLDWDFSLFGTLVLLTRPCFEHEVERALDRVCLVCVLFLYFKPDEEDDEDGVLFLAAVERVKKI